MKHIFNKISDRLVIFAKKVTFSISKATTAIVLVLGSLVGFNTTSDEMNGGRLIIAGMIFIFGAPIGVIIFGYKFSMMIWLSMVVIILFSMNLHNAWEVALSLKHGGLDYVMVDQAITSVQSVVPTEEAIHNLNDKVKGMNKRYRTMSGGHKGFDGHILSPLNAVPALED